MAKEMKPNEIIGSIDYNPPKTDWMSTPVQIKPGMFCWGAKAKSINTVGFRPFSFSP